MQSTYPLTARRFPDITFAWRWLNLRWNYNQKGNRDYRLDFLRGFAVYAMVIDHLG